MTRYGMVIDLSRCMGCQTCVAACQLHHNQRPGIAWINVDAYEWGEWPDSDRAYMPHACMHCDNAPCVPVCPTESSIQQEDGIVTINYDTCIACEACIEACPYDARQITADDAWYFDAENPAPYEEYGVQHYNVAEKCIFCVERVEEGDINTYCSDVCPVNARIFGDLDDPNSEVSKYIEEHDAEQLEGTAMYYVKGNHDFDLQSIFLVEGMEPPTAQAQETTTKETSESDDGVNPAYVAAGVAAGAAVIGGGYAVKKKKDKESDAKESDN